MILELVEAFVAGSPVALGLYALLRSGGYEARVNRNWEEAARRLGGTLLRTNGWFGPPPMTIDATWHGAHVVAVAGSTIGAAVRPDTEVSANAVAPTDFKIGLDSRANDVQLGRLWLTAKVAGEMDLARPYMFFLQDGKAFATRLGVEEDAGRLEVAMKAVAALAARGQQIADEWGRLAAHLEGMIHAPLWAGDEACILIQRQGLDARLEVKKMQLDAGPGQKPRLVTILRAPRGSSSVERFLLYRTEPALALLQRDGDLTLASDRDAVLQALSSEPGTTRGRLGDRELALAFDASDPAHVAGSAEELSVVLVGLVLDPARLQAAVRLMDRLLKLEPAGPYR